MEGQRAGGRTDKWRDGQTDRYVDRQVGGRSVAAQTDTRIGGYISRKMDGWKEERKVDGWADGWAEGWLRVR